MPNKPLKRKTPKRFSEGHGTEKQESGLIRLNKFIANAGICSRREADQLIVAGAIKVNGKTVRELGTKISRDDKVQYGEVTIGRERPVYVLLNKPKGFITTTDDPFNRKTVMELVRNACRERIYPVGRLDRNTTGLLLFTNDGEVAKKLTHPSHQIEKLYHVYLDKALKKSDMIRMTEGLELDDGFIRADEVSWVEGAGDKKQVGIRIHSGKNHIVRRIFEHLGYKILRLDRVVFAGLTKKDLPRGKWRFLTREEINRLKMIGKR
jgi:23S rRNA pseudouridine2605 synthase